MTYTRPFISSELLSVAVAAMMLCIPPRTTAYDFSAMNDNGKRIYYNQLSDTEVEVTYETKLSPTFSYSGDLEIPEKVMYMGKEMRVTSVGERALFGCRTLKSVNLPPTVSSIGQWAFGWCDSIAEIDIPESVTRLGADAFDGCYGLEKITVDGRNPIFVSSGDAVYTADKLSLVACSPTAEGLFEVAEDTERIGQRAFGGCTFIDSVKIASTVHTIGQDAFSFCNSLRSIYLPASVEDIGEKAFADCSSLERIVADTANVFFSSLDGTLYTNDFSRLIQSPEANPCLHPHPLVKEIGSCAFLNNRGLTSINIPDGTERIGVGAFAGCERLTSVVIPEGLRQLGALAFGLCENLENIYVLCPEPDRISMGEGAFSFLSSGSRTLYVPRGSRHAYASAPGWKDIGNIVETDAFLSQTITWDYARDRFIDDGHIELGATASSGLPVRYSIGSMSRGVAVIDGNLLKILTPGVIYVTAYQPGNASFLPAESVTLAYNDPSGTDGIDSGCEIKVFGGRGEIIIDGAAENAKADVYDTGGIKVYSGMERRIRVDGMKIYMVRLGDRTYKVAVR